MKILQTKIQREMLKNPTRLEWLRELDKRQALKKEWSDELIRLERGEEGVQKVLETLKKYGDPKWAALQNLWLKYFGNFESDLLLMTKFGLQTFEIKHYTGSYEYLHSQFLLDGASIGQNPISQSQRAFINVRKIIHDHSEKIPIQGNLIFTGQNCDVKISDPVAELEIMMLHQLSGYIKKLRTHEKTTTTPPINQDKVLKILEGFETESVFKPGAIIGEMEKNMQRGIMCSKCGSYDIKITKYEVKCACSTIEPRENAIVRTICEYGVIYFDKHLDLNKLVDFFGGQVSRTNIRKYLIKHFKQVSPNKNTLFINMRLPFVKLVDLFHLTQKYIHRISYYQ